MTPPFMTRRILPQRKAGVKDAVDVCDFRNVNVALTTLFWNLNKNDGEFCLVNLRMASQTIASWKPLAEWLQAVDKLRRAGFEPTGPVSHVFSPGGG